MIPKEELVIKAGELARDCIQIAREIRLALCPHPEGCPTVPENDPIQVCQKMWDEYRNKTTC